jgi:hypothetical protein
MAKPTLVIRQSYRLPLTPPHSPPLPSPLRNIMLPESASRTPSDPSPLPEAQSVAVVGEVRQSYFPEMPAPSPKKDFGLKRLWLAVCRRLGLRRVSR